MSKLSAPPRRRTQLLAAEPAAATAVADLAASARDEAVLRIKKALVTSRLTLADQDAGGDPYNSRTGRVPGAAWRGRSRY